MKKGYFIYNVYTDEERKATSLRRACAEAVALGDEWMVAVTGLRACAVNLMRPEAGETAEAFEARCRALAKDLGL